MSAPTSARFPRERSAVPAARAFVAYTLRSAGAPAEVVERLVLAVAEACNNAILHAHGPVFTVSVAIAGDLASVTISDTGAGFDPPEHPEMPAPQATGKRGLPLMRALVDRVAVASGVAGTTVVLEHPFRRARTSTPVGADSR